MTLILAVDINKNIKSDLDITCYIINKKSIFASLGKKDIFEICKQKFFFNLFRTTDKYSCYHILLICLKCYVHLIKLLFCFVIEV